MVLDRKNQALSALFGSMTSYIYLFWGLIPNYFIAGSTSRLFGIESPGEVRNADDERAQIFFEWLSWSNPTAEIFHRTWQYHRFLDRNQLREDWVPPLEYFLQRLPGLALPQEPQIRRTLHTEIGKRVVRIRRI
jgi:hypothetical protein